MFDFSFSELSLVMAVALVLIGPEELPGIIRTVRNTTRKSRKLFKEFTNSIMEMDEINSLQDEVKKLNNDIKRIVDLDGNLQEAYDITEIMPEIEKAKRSVETVKDEIKTPPSSV